MEVVGVGASVINIVLTKILEAIPIHGHCFRGELYLPYLSIEQFSIKISDVYILQNQ